MIRLIAEGEENPAVQRHSKTSQGSNRLKSDEAAFTWNQVNQPGERVRRFERKTEEGVGDAKIKEKYSLRQFKQNINEKSMRSNWDKWAGGLRRAATFRIFSGYRQYIQ